MKKREKILKKKKDWIFYTTRILSILFLLFLTLFSLDVFDSCANFLECSLALLMHNLPVLILLILFIFAWRYELVGAITFTLAGIAYIITTMIRVPWYLALSWGMIIALPCFFVAVLYYLSWKRKKCLY